MTRKEAGARCACRDPFSLAAAGAAALPYVEWLRPALGKRRLRSLPT